MAETAKKSIRNKGINRRRFMAGAGAAAMSFAIVKPGLVHGTQANSKIRLGMIGCGDRGAWIADLFNQHGGYEIVAAADYFEDRAGAFGEKFDIPASSRFTTLSCYRRLLERKVDAVAIISPPFFHPAQAAAAVDAGCHVYLAKPIAVDVPGCYSIAESGKKATNKKLCFAVDFQTRSNEFYAEAVKRVHAGAIGEFTFGEATYHTGRLSIKTEPDGSTEARLRNWVFDKALSGDIITEQNIHALDVASWIMNEPPIYAFCTGGRKVRVDVGDCSDHFAGIYQYSNNVGITFSSRQFNGHGTIEGIKNRMFGSKGVLETTYGGMVLIRGEKFYPGGRTDVIYQEGVVNNIKTFYESVTVGKFDNPTVAPSVRSNLVTILGRTAAHEKRQVYWAKLIKSTDKLDGKIAGLKT
jgi:myo-inositol 2-dehydrogenase/D-chiro-inositol 1-dehydrogenase